MHGENAPNWARAGLIEDFMPRAAASIVHGSGPQKWPNSLCQSGSSLATMAFGPSLGKTRRGFV